MNVLVVVPTYNEGRNIHRVSTGVLAHPWTRLLVVDDASPDGTADIAEALGNEFPGRLEVLRRKGPRGLGLAYVDGLSHALETNVAAICQMDADLSHDPAYLPALREALSTSDLVIGSRYIQGGAIKNWPPHRLALSGFANRYIRTITGLSPRDCTGGYRMWRREALARIPIANAHANGYAFLTEMLYHAGRLGCRIREVPITFVERQEGYSKVSSKVLVESLITPWRLALSGRVRRQA
jgi:dolichol-phosphate mannosyltransferase